MSGLQMDGINFTNELNDPLQSSSLMPQPQMLYEDIRNSVAETAGSSGSNLTSNVMANMVNGWHGHFNPKFRQYAVKKFIQDILGNSESDGAITEYDLRIIVPDVLTGSLDEFAQQVENDFYHTCKSEHEYYYLLEEKSNEIRNRIDENRRRIQQQEQQQPQQFSLSQHLLQQSEQQQPLQFSLAQHSLQQPEQQQSQQFSLAQHLLQQPEQQQPLQFSLAQHSLQQPEQPQQQFSLARNLLQQPEQPPQPFSLAQHLLQQPQTSQSVDTIDATNQLNLPPQTSQRNVSKEWHKKVNTEFREPLVKILTQAFLLTSVSQTTNTEGVSAHGNLPVENDLTDSPVLAEANAKHLECDMYNLANSESEYYSLIVEKVYNIRKERDEKDHRTIKQELQQQQIIQPSSTTKASNQYVPKDWHRHFDMELREHLRKKLVEAAQLLPSDSDNQIRDRNILNTNHTEENVEAFVAEIESEIYQVADSKSEYYRLIAEKFYYISEESDEKNRKIKEQKLQQRQQMQQQIQPQIIRRSSWQNQITPILRDHLAKKLVSAILPLPPQPTAGAAQSGIQNGSCIITSNMMQNLETYTKKVEGEIYGSANSKSEYYHMLGEKYYKIQKELAERRKRRKQTMLQQQQQQQ